jgi:hypothetical protein
VATLDTPLILPGKKFESDQRVHRANSKALEDFAISIFGQLVPVGSIIMYGGQTAPSGWLMANGASVSRVTYSALFAIFGTAFGTGDGSSTFGLPNISSVSGTNMRVPLGVGIGVTLGQTYNLVATTGTVVKGAAVNFIIKT